MKQCVNYEKVNGCPTDRPDCNIWLFIITFCCPYTIKVSFGSRFMVDRRLCWLFRVNGQLLFRMLEQTITVWFYWYFNKNLYIFDIKSLDLNTWSDLHNKPCKLDVQPVTFYCAQLFKCWISHLIYRYDNKTCTHWIIDIYKDPFYELFPRFHNITIHQPNYMQYTLRQDIPPMVVKPEKIDFRCFV